MLIDAHNHPNWHGYDAKRILNNMDEQGIDRMWLFTWEVPEDEYDPSYHKALPPGGDGNSAGRRAAGGKGGARPLRAGLFPASETARRGGPPAGRA